MAIDKKIRFSIIGCGRISYRYVEEITAHPNAELAAVCDLNIARAEEARGEMNIPVYRNYNDMFQNEDIDVACIMSPSGMHAEHAIDIIEKYRKHVVIEKPIALKMSDGIQLNEIADREQVNVFAVHQNRYNKAIQKIKSIVESDDFGKIVLGTVRIRWSRGQKYYDRDPWRGTWAFDGGALTNQSIHHIDLLQWLLGDIYSVSAVGATQLVDVDVEDTACAWIKFKNGALGIVEATTAARPENNDLEASISVLSENGTVIVEGAAVNKLTTCTFQDFDMGEYSESPPNVYGFGHKNIIENVVDVVTNGGDPLISGKDALKSIQFLHALYASMEAGGKEILWEDNPISAKLGVIREEDEWIANLYRTDVVLKKGD